MFNTKNLKVKHANITTIYNDNYNGKYIKSN